MTFEGIAFGQDQNVLFPVFDGLGLGVEDLSSWPMQGGGGERGLVG
ncbi:MAG: hypothetical protein U0931_35555 [Vulcanimicrobiota bacterium]